MIIYLDLDCKDLGLVHVEPSSKPVFVKAGQELKFYIRTGDQTQKLGIQASIEYIQEHWPS